MSKKEKGLMDMDHSVVAVGVGWVEVEEGIRGINCSGKNATTKNRSKGIKKQQFANIRNLVSNVIQS